MQESFGDDLRETVIETKSDVGGEQLSAPAKPSMAEFAKMIEANSRFVGGRLVPRSSRPAGAEGLARQVESVRPEIQRRNPELVKTVRDRDPQKK